MAIGIVSFGIMSLVGMLPLGLTNFRQAMARTVESQIVQSLSNEILLANFSTLDSYASKTWYFDYQGDLLPEGAAAGAPDGAIYSAGIALSPIGNTNTPTSLAQTDSGTAARITITRLTDGPAGALGRSWSLLIANNGL